MSIEWTEAHRREALRRTYEIAAELVAEGKEREARAIVMEPYRVGHEGVWREWLSYSASLDPARIEAEVRRVDGLATGRLVRETSERHAVRFSRADGRGVQPLSTLEQARRMKRATCDKGAKVVTTRVTRIRRAP